MKAIKSFLKKYTLIKAPLILITTVTAIHIITSLFTYTEKIQKYISYSYTILYTFLATYILVKFIDILTKKLKKKVAATESKLDDQILPLAVKTVKIVIYIIAIIVVLDNLGVNVTSIIAGLGIGGLAVALAAQDTFKNLIGSITLLFDRPFEADERVKFDGIDGIVKTIGFRSTKIETLDGTMVSVPNSKTADAAIDNISKRPFIKNVFTIGLTYDTSYTKTQKALKIIRTILKEHESTDNYWVYFKTFAAYSLDILVIHWCKHTAYEEFLKATEQINLEIKKQFEAEGIEFAFPTQTIHVEK